MNKNIKCAIVNGGSAGIGRAVVEKLLARGYSVGVIARGENRLQAMQQEFGDDRIYGASADSADHKALEKAYQAITAKFGEPEIWVNALMLTSFSPFKEMSADEFQTIINATFIGQVNGTRLALSGLAITNIVNIGSGLSYRSVPLQSAYCAAKHAINGFTSALRSELIRDNRDVALSLIQLPAVNTPQFTWAKNRMSYKPQPAPPIYQPEVAANAVMKAIDNNSRELFVGRSVLKLVFGDMVLPNFLDKKLAKDGADLQKSQMPDPGNREDNLNNPVEHASTSHGDFDNRASDKGIIVDADVARYVFFSSPWIIILIMIIADLLD